MAEATLARARTRLRRFPWSVVSSLVLAATLIAVVATDRPAADSVTEIGSLIRCPVCQGVAITDSPAPMARDMMSVLREALAQGASRQEAIDTVLGAYPGSLLLEPALSAATVALWAIPGLALLAGLGLALTVRRSEGASPQGAGERREAEIRHAQIQSDLDDLALQEVAGEIDPEPARLLRQAYRAELADARADLAATAAPAPPSRSPRRAAVGAMAVLASLVLIVVAAGSFLVDRPRGASGLAGLEGDPADYSNETLAAVIAANADHPMIDGMRLALAERYFETGDYQAAFPYFLDVASSEAASATQAATALTRLGWMAYEGNGEVDTALGLLAEARALAPDDSFPLYLEGLIRWCGQGRPGEAAAAFRQVLEAGVDDDEVRARVEADLAAAEAGQECPR